MLPTKETVKRALEETEKSWDFYWKMVDKNDGKDVIVDYNMDYEVGDVLYMNLQVGYPHELAFGHLCYVVKKSYSKLLVIPIVTPRGPCKDYEKDIIMEGCTAGRLQFFDMRTVDKQRIDKRKEVIKVITDRKEIMKSIMKFMKEEK